MKPQIFADEHEFDRDSYLYSSVKTCGFNFLSV